MAMLNISTSEVRNIASDIGARASLYQEKLTTLYEKFNNLASIWSAPDYDSAASIMAQNKEPLMSLGETLLNISKALNNVADDYDQKIQASANQYRVEG